jgi:outer membrane protein insertion porin family
VNPFYTVDGVTRGFNVFFRETDLSKASGFSSVSSITDEYGFDLTFGYPISEISRLNFAVGMKHTSITTQLPFGAKIVELEEFFREEGNDLFAYNLTSGWIRSTLNRAPFATSGTEQRASVLFTVPTISDLEYFTVRLTNRYYQPLVSNDWIFHLSTNVAYGAGYGDSSKLPYFENFFSGGFNSVRGYRIRSLGNKSHIFQPTMATGLDENGNVIVLLDDQGNPLFQAFYDADGNQIYPQENVREFQSFGGNLRTEASLELIVPTPFVKDARMLRTVLFVDAGNVFDTARGFNPSISELRYSTGASLTWITPLAPLTFIYAIPIDEQPGDFTRRFEFQLGTVF